MDEPLRVAYTIEQCWHKVPGGTAVAGIETARALRARRDVTVVGVAARHSSPPPPPWLPPIEVAHLPLPRLVLYEAWHRLRRPRVERATGPVDVIHATTIAMPPRSRPLAVTVHDLAFLHFPEHFTRRGRHFFCRALALALAEADMILCSSRAVAEDCLAAGFEQDRLRHVPLGVRTDPVSPENVARVLDAHGLKRPYIVWTGTIEPRKNLSRLLAAFRSLPQKFDLVLVGPKGWREDLETLVAPVRDRVKVVGFVPEVERDALYAGAAVMCFPSLMEGFGFPVLEAMAQGTPVVTSVGTSTEELAGGAAVLVDPHDEDAIADGIRRVLEDEEMAADLAVKGRGRAAQYTWERTAALVGGCYAELKERT